MPFTVLFVCTGNVCRSPTAELICRSLAGPRVGVSSAGTAALTGDPIDPPTAALLTNIGLDPRPHRARQLTADLVLDADLVLTADTTQRDTVMTDVPSAFRRTFTLKEFARAAADGAARHGPGDPVRTVTLASRYRGWDGRNPLVSDDVTDAFQASPAEVHRMMVEVNDAVAAVVRVLGVSRPRPTPAPPDGFAALLRG